MRLACPNQLSPTQNLMGNGAQLSARNRYLPSDNPTSLVAWFRMGVGVTSSGGFASAWADQSGNGNNLLQATGSFQPAYDGSAILTFDGVDNKLKCVGFTLNQPVQISILFKQIAFTNSDYIVDGNANATGTLYQNTTTPDISLYAGSIAATNSNMTIGSFFAVTYLLDGASSSLLVGTTSATTGNAGALNPGGLTVGGGGTGTFFANVAVKEIILRNVNDATIRAADHAYLQTL